MQYTTTIRLVVAEAPDQPVANAQVALFDRDRVTRDDALGTATTDGNGEASFHYSSDRYVDLDDHVGGVFPDLYAVVYDANDQVVLSTRTDTVPNTPIKRLTIPVPRDLLVRHRLAPLVAPQA